MDGEKFNSDTGKHTKDEIIGVVFSALRPKNHHIFADIGCGSGRVAEFFAAYVRKVYAVDTDRKAVDAASRRLQNLDNVEVRLMDGRDFLMESDYDIVFFGGTRGIEEMLEMASRKAERIAVNAARMEVAARAIAKMRDLGIFQGVLMVSVYRGYELSGGTAFKPLNPVFVVVGCL